MRFIKALCQFLRDETLTRKIGRSIVEFLFELGDDDAIDSANKICNFYASRGQEFLRDIYEKNRNLKANG